MYERILLCTDGSENSQCANREAIKLAKNTTAKLYVLEVIDLTEEFEALAPGLVPQFEGEARENLKAIAEEAARHGVKAEGIVKNGQPHEKILETAREIRADALVLATHGRKGLLTKLLGSVTRRVIAEAFVPVIIVHSRYCSIT